MGEDRPGDGLPNLTPLILKAKYGEDEESCRSAGARVVESLRESGRYSAMIDLCMDAGTPPFLSEEARKNILAAAFIACRNSGTNLPLEDVATRQDVPLDIALHAGVALVKRHSEPYDGARLMALVKDRRFHDEARVEAGNAILSHAEAGLEFSMLFELATGHDVMYDVKKPAGHALIRLAVELGNYPVLIRLNSEAKLPVDIRIALEDKVEEAAKNAMGLAYAEGDAAILKDISDDKRLPASIRGRAMGCHHDLSKRGPSDAPGMPDPQMTADLMHRLGKNAGVLRTSATPPPASERPTQKEPLSRLKR